MTRCTAPSSRSRSFATGPATYIKFPPSSYYRVRQSPAIVPPANFYPSINCPPPFDKETSIIPNKGKKTKVEGKWANEKISKWVKRGMLTKEFILGVQDKRIQEGYSINDDEELALTTAFQSACNTNGHLTETSFISLLEETASFPPSQETNAGLKIIYESIAYLSLTPFPKRPHYPKPENLSLAQLRRGLIWALPHRYRYLIEERNWSRMRTRADHRRLLFQSLASLHSTDDAPYYDADTARKLAVRNSFDMDSTYLDMFWDYCVGNCDDDGDEIYHNLLDVLYSTQEVVGIHLAGVHRDEFRGIAKRVAVEETNGSPPKVQHLAISAERFTALLTLLSGLQFQSDATNINASDTYLSQFESSARSLCASFTDEVTGVVTWPVFDNGMRSIAPYLFDPFYKLVSMAFLQDKEGTVPYTGGWEFCLGGFGELPRGFLARTDTVVTLPVLAQLVCFLAGSVYTPDIARQKHYSCRDWERSVRKRCGAYGGHGDGS